MINIQIKHFAEPDELLTLPNVEGQIVVLGDVYVARYVYQPGWQWSKDVKPKVNTPSCLHHHQGIVLAGHLQFIADEGAQRTAGPGDAFDVPPGHDARVVGDEPCIAVEFRGARDWGKPSATGVRVLATLLMTDIVASTALATRLGDTAWKELLARHFERIRLELERFRGHEITTTGDGILAMFDGTVRAIHCGWAIGRAAREDGVEVRAGIHSGEVERHAGNLRGVTVHTVARIAALAGAGEILLSSSTVALLEGSGLQFEDAGEHELKGLSGSRRIYRLRPITENAAG